MKLINVTQYNNNCMASVNIDDISFYYDYNGDYTVINFKAQSNSVLDVRESVDEINRLILK